MKYGPPRSIVTDGLRACSAAMNEIGVAADRQEVGRGLNNRAENSHQPFRRRERAMQRFRSMKTLQNSVQFMLTSTTISIRSAMSSPAGFTNKGEPSRWPSGAASRPYRRLRPQRLNLAGGAAHNASRARRKAAYASAYEDELSAFGSWRALTLLIAAAAELRSVCNPRPTAAIIADPSVESLMK